MLERRLRDVAGLTVSKTWQRAGNARNAYRLQGVRPAMILGIFWAFL